MSSTQFIKPTSDYPGLLPVLPLLYIAWADEVLMPQEIDNIKELIDNMAWLSAGEKDLVTEWLNPRTPPSASQMAYWLSYIKTESRQLDKDDRRGIAGLGLSLAQSNSQFSNEFVNDDTHKHLVEIEEALGLISEEAKRSLLQNEASEEEDCKDCDFSVETMNQLLTHKHKDIREKVRQLLKDPEFDLDLISRDKNVFREQTLKWSQLLADQGLGAIAFPEKYGGLNDMSKYVIAFEELAFHDLSLLIKFGVQFGLWGGSVYWLGTEKHHDKYLKDIGTLKIPGCFAMTETGHGSNVRDLLTTAVYNPETETFTIHSPGPDAGKEYIGNAACHGQMATVFAQLRTQNEDYGIHAFVVPIRKEDGSSLENVHIIDNGHKLGLNGVDNGRIYFDKVEIPRENLLDKFGSVDKEGNYSSPINSPGRRFFTMLGTLVGGRVAVPLGGLSATKKALTIAIRYASKRRQFGAEGKEETIILDYPTHQRRLLPLLANAYAYHFALHYLSERFVNRTEEEAQEIEALAAGLKSMSTWNTTATIQECREACGGKGYLAENQFADMKADTDIFTTFEGDNTVLMQLVAKSRLAEFRKEFGKMNVSNILRFLKDQAETIVLEKNPVVTRRTSEEHLRSEEFLSAAFSYREEQLLSSVGMSLGSAIRSGMDSYDAFLKHQNDCMKLSKAYIHRVTLEQFNNALSSAEAEIYDVLKDLRDLWALSNLEIDKAYFLEQGYIESAKSIAITAQVDELCLKLKKNAVGLVDAFGISEHLIKAPIIAT